MEEQIKARKKIAPDPRKTRQQQFLGLQIGSGVWAEGVPNIALTYANVQRPSPYDILHCLKQDPHARNVWLLAYHPSEHWVSLPLHSMSRHRVKLEML